MVATMVSLVVVSGMAVVLRVYARYAKKLTLKADDYLVIAAWVSLTHGEFVRCLVLDL